MAVFIGTFQKSDGLSLASVPWYTYTGDGFQASDFFIFPFTSTTSKRPIAMYKYPIIMRYNTLLSGIQYTSDANNIAANPSNYVYKLYCYWGVTGFNSTNRSGSSGIRALLGKLYDAYYNAGDGYDWENSGFLRNPTFECSSVLTNTYGDRRERFIMSDFPLSLVYPILPSNSDAGLTSEVMQLFANFRPLRVDETFAGFCSNIYQYNNSEVQIGSNQSMFPCFMGMDEDPVDGINNAVTNVFYPSYSPCLGVQKVNNSAVSAVLCCKPGSILLGNFVCRYYSSGYKYINLISMTYFGVEKVS